MATVSATGAALGGIPRPAAGSGSVALLTAKLAPPDLAHATVLRPRVLALLSRAVQRSPLTLLSGPAGSGKSVVAASWRATESRGPSVAWITLDDYDDEPAAFWSYVVAALTGAGVALPPIPRLAPGEPTPGGFPAMLAGAITAAPQPVVLIVDNADHVTDRGIIAGLDLLIRHAASRLRLVLCARADPQLPLHQYRLAGTMSEIRGDELAFTAGETADLLAAIGVPVSAEVATRLCAETQGWAVGLRLAAAPIKQGASPERLATSLAQDDGSVAQYLFAEVLADQPASVRRLLLRISVTGELHAELVDRLAGRPGSRRVLTALARANAFVEESAGAPGGFRIHPLFREMLLAQLRYDHPGEVAGLHRTCARWYADAGRAQAAIGHAVAAGDWAFAARLLVDDLVVPRLLAHGSDAVLRGLRSVPAALEGPEAAVLRAAAALADGVAPSQPDLSIAAEAIVAGDRPAVRASAALTCLAADAAAGAPVAEVLGRAQVAQEALVGLPEGDRSGRREYAAVLAGSRGLAVLRGDSGTEEITAQLRVAAGAAQAAGARRLRRRAIALLALLEALEGRLTRAVQLATEAETLSSDAGTEEPDRPVAVATALGWVHLQRYELVEAREWLGRAQARGRHAPPSPEAAVVDAGLALGHGLALRVRREYDAAEECLGTALAGPDTPRWLRERALVEAARLAVLRGRPDEATHLLDDPAVKAAQRARAGGLVALLGGRSIGADTAADEHGPPADVVEHRILRACRLAEAGTVPAAVDELERALELARPELHRLPFVDAPPQGRRLLRMHPRLQVPAHWLSLSSGAAPVLAARSGPAGPMAMPPMTQELSERETEVLQHLAEMLSTAEIAATMFISVNTVRTHIRSILRKLGVSRRNQAVRRARDRGLL